MANDTDLTFYQVDEFAKGVKVEEYRWKLSHSTKIFQSYGQL